MTRELIGFIALTLVGAIALAIFFSVRGKRARQEAFFDTPRPTQAGELLANGLYVSTVLASAPLDRVWAHGLGIRGKVEVSLSHGGINLDRTGEVGFLIPSQSLLAIGRASATIDKGVEMDGLLVIEWYWGDQVVLTNLRFVDFEKGKLVEEKISALIGAHVE